MLSAVTLAPGQSAASAPINVPMTATGRDGDGQRHGAQRARQQSGQRHQRGVGGRDAAYAPAAAPGPGRGGGCTVNPDARFDPLLWMMLLVGGVAGTLRRRRTVGTGSDRH